MNKKLIIFASLICFFLLTRYNESSKTPSVDLTQAQKANICRYLVAGIFSKDPAIVQHINTDPSGIIEVKYTRPDGTNWINFCDLQNGNNEIVWAAFLPDEGRVGRWREEDRTTIHYKDHQAIFEIPQAGGKTVEVPL